MIVDGTDKSPPMIDVVFHGASCSDSANQSPTQSAARPYVRPRCGLKTRGSRRAETVTPLPAVKDVAPSTVPFAWTPGGIPAGRAVLRGEGLRSADHRRLYGDGTPRTKHVTSNMMAQLDGTATARSYFTVLQSSKHSGEADIDGDLAPDVTGSPRCPSPRPPPS